jgi:hypothetical protein
VRARSSSASWSGLDSQSMARNAPGRRRESHPPPTRRHEFDRPGSGQPRAVPVNPVTCEDGNGRAGRMSLDNAGTSSRAPGRPQKRLSPEDAADAEVPGEHAIDGISASPAPSPSSEPDQPHTPASSSWRNCAEVPNREREPSRQRDPIPVPWPARGAYDCNSPPESRECITDLGQPTKPVVAPAPSPRRRTTL